MQNWIVKIPSNPEKVRYVVLKISPGAFFRIQTCAVGGEVPTLLTEKDLMKVRSMLDENKVVYTVHEIMIP